MLTSRSRAIIPAVAFAALSVGAAGIETDAGPASIEPRVTAPPTSSSADTGETSNPEPEPTLYDAEEYSEDTLLDEWTGVGPFNVDYPCGALSVAEAVDMVPAVIGASVDGGNCYYYISADATDEDTTRFRDAFVIDPAGLGSDADAADWFFDEQDVFFNQVYADGEAPPGEGCVWIEGVGRMASWCWAPGENPTLLVQTPFLGIRVTGSDPILELAGHDEQRAREILIEIAERILGNTGLAKA